MPVEDIFSISGRGTVVTGRLERGVMRVGDAAELVGLRETPLSTILKGIEMFQRTLQQAVAGDNVGVLLEGIDKSQVERGMVLARPGSILAHSRFEAEIEFEPRKPGARAAILATQDRLQLRFHCADVIAEIFLAEARELVPPGVKLKLSVQLPRPFALEPGLQFAIHENGRAVGRGRVVAITK